MKKIDLLKDEVSRLKGLLELSENSVKRLEIDLDKVRKDLANCQEAYERCQKIPKS